MKEIDDFEIVIRRDGSTFVAGVPQLSLYARADSPSAALEAVQAKKNQLASDVATVGVSGVFPNSLSRPSEARSGNALGLFAAKVAIVCLFFAAAVAASGAVIAARVHTAVVDVMGSDIIGGPQFWTKVEQELQRSADPSRELPEQKKQQLLSDIKVLVERWRPFVAAVAPLFNVNAQSSSGLAAPARTP